MEINAIVIKFYWYGHEMNASLLWSSVFLTFMRPGRMAYSMLKTFWKVSSLIEVIMFWFKFLRSLDMVAVEQVKSHYPIYPKIIFRFTHTGMRLWALRE